MTPEIIAIVTVGIALAGVILASAHSANAWRTWKG